MKSAVTGYERSPFFFDQHNEENPAMQRTVAWAGTEDLQERIFKAFADIVGDRIDYLFKRNIGANENGIEWDRLQGGILNSELFRVIGESRDWFFSDGGFQFCVRAAESTDYFAYDDHGLFWIYSRNRRFREVLEEFGFEPRNDELICDSPHWHIYRKDSDIEARKFQSDLVDASVYVDRGEQNK